MSDPTLPPGLTRRQFLEDVLDVLGDADSIVHYDADGTVAWEVTRYELLQQLAAEMDRP